MRTSASACAHPPIRIRRPRVLAGMDPPLPFPCPNMGDGVVVCCVQIWCERQAPLRRRPGDARPAARVREDSTVAQIFRTGESEGGGLIVMQGGEAGVRHETDHEPFFRQESSFAWAFGVKEPDCFGAIHVRSGKSVLFIPHEAAVSADLQTNEHASERDGQPADRTSASSGVQGRPGLWFR